MYATDGAAMGLCPSGNPVIGTAVSDCNPNTPPQSKNRISLSVHSLHAKHETKSLMLDMRERLCEDICHHITRSDKSEVQRFVGDTFPDEMVSNIDMFRSAVVDGVPGEEIRRSIVDI